MLILSRRPGQKIVIGENVEVTIVEVKGFQVRVGVTAPKSISVHREEIHARIARDRSEKGTQ